MHQIVIFLLSKGVQMTDSKSKVVPFRLIFDPDFFEQLRQAAKREQLSIAAFLRSAAVARMREIETQQRN